MAGDGVKGKPAIFREIHFRNGMGIGVVNLIEPRKNIELTGGKSNGNPRRNPQRSQHHRQRRRKLVRLTPLALKQKRLHQILPLPQGWQLRLNLKPLFHRLGQKQRLFIGRCPGRIRLSQQPFCLSPQAIANPIRHL